MKKVIFGMMAAMAVTANAMAQDAPVEVQATPVAAPASVADAPAAAVDVPFQVVRAGDSQMSCEALIAEANALNGEMMAMQNAMSQRAMDMSRSRMSSLQAQQGVSTAMSLGGLAAAFVPGAGLALGAAQSVAGMAQRAAAAQEQQNMMSDIDDMMLDVQARTDQLMPVMNRADHLTDLSMAKGC
ncbi:MAG: hypothetical protein EON91_06880 [Brevundimonas sp.]|uniref:hypothetical protein n=1 Tax=Brevundimonas sp. TaxID=1871086 RepID=UPI0012229E91|nr:hypothetical protein [Brevundimonas sp.]RZJ18052.1 MAG: hypothetical protein EON91_06880 [Brevundimonas sp.]